MEIKFEKVTYIKNEHTMFSKPLLNNFSYTFKEKKITGIINNNDDVIGFLLSSLIKPKKGTIYFGNVKINKNSFIKNIDSVKNLVSYIPRNSIFFLKNTVEEEFLTVLHNFKKTEVEKKMHDALTLVGLTSDLLQKNPQELSFTTQKKIQLAIAFIHNPEIIILDNFEKGFNNKEQLDLKKMLYKIKVSYNKMVILITKNTDFLLDVVDNLIVIHNGNLMFDGTKELFYNYKIYDYLEIPELVKFVFLANKKGRNIQAYYDIKEVIKAVYRDV